MDLRYRLAVVTGAGGGLGRELAVALSRVGAGVLSADPDGTAAEETAVLVRAARVSAWALPADLTEETDLRMLAARCRDLGGADLLVTTNCDRDAADRLTQLFVDDLPARRGRRDGTPAAVHVGSPSGTAWSDARVMAVVASPTATTTEVTRVVVELLSRGTAGDVVALD